MSERRGMIRASGMGEYAFCARAWWLRRAGAVPTRGAEAREAGRVWHERHGARVERARRLKLASKLLALLALALLALTVLLRLLG